MWDLLEFVLDNLEIEDQATKDIRDQIKGVRGNKELANKLSVQLDREAQLNNCTQCPSRHFHAFFLACIHYEIGAIVQTQSYIKRAIRDFNRMGSRWNELLAIWVNGEIYMGLGRFMPARQALEHTVEMLQKKAQVFRRKDQYEKREECFQHIAKIRSRLMNPAGNWEGKPVKKRKKAKTTQQPFSHHNKRPSWRRSQIIFPVQSQIRAGTEGDFIFECQPDLDAVLDELVFNGKTHYFYNIREEGNPIILNPRVYRWFRIDGNSMNQARPVSIMDGDYILAIDLYMSNMDVRIGDIVIANLHNPLQNERAGVLKKYTSVGLESQSSDEYPIISMGEANIRGIAIAVAKPV